jgi:hypothetical protein
VSRAQRRLRAVACVLSAATALSTVAGCGGGTAAKVGQSRWSPYVAIGDSYTAAPGRSADVDSGCARSSDNYPSLVALELHVADFTDDSCAGAQTTAVTRSQMKGVPPQLTGLDARTRLVTVGIGGNDLDIATAVVVLCPALGLKDPTGSPCTDAAARTSPDLLESTLAKLRTRLDGVLRAVHRRAPHARVLVVGYPQIIPPTGSCRKRYPAAANDYFYLRQVNQGLDDALRTAARKAGDTFIDIWAASAGHDICAKDPWVNAYGATRGAAAAVHPFPAEQAAVARLVVAALSRTP